MYTCAYAKNVSPNADNYRTPNVEGVRKLQKWSAVRLPLPEGSKSAGPNLQGNSNGSDQVQMHVAGCKIYKQVY